MVIVVLIRLSVNFKVAVVCTYSRGAVRWLFHVQAVAGMSAGSSVVQQPGNGEKKGARLEAAGGAAEVWGRHVFVVLLVAGRAQADAVVVEPVLAVVACQHRPVLVVRQLAQAPQLCRLLRTTIAHTFRLLPTLWYTCYLTSCQDNACKKQPVSLTSEL